VYTAGRGIAAVDGTGIPIIAVDWSFNAPVRFSTGVGIAFVGLGAVQSSVLASKSRVARVYSASQGVITRDSGVGTFSGAQIAAIVHAEVVRAAVQVGVGAGTSGTDAGFNFAVLFGADNGGWPGASVAASSGIDAPNGAITSTKGTRIRWASDGLSNAPYRGVTGIRSTSITISAVLGSRLAPKSVVTPVVLALVGSIAADICVVASISIDSRGTLAGLASSRGFTQVGANTGLVGSTKSLARFSTWISSDYETS
jgi:hypothetical protein